MTWRAICAGSYAKDQLEHFAVAEAVSEPGPARGRAVQVDPMKPKLKPTGTKRLKLNCDKLLSTSAFKINLRRYSEASASAGPAGAGPVAAAAAAGAGAGAGAGTGAGAVVVAVAGPGTGAGPGTREVRQSTPGRGLHSSTFQLNLSRS